MYWGSACTADLGIASIQGSTHTRPRVSEALTGIARYIIERAKMRGLTGDRSKIRSYTVRRNPRPKSKNRYVQVFKVLHS